jgi:ribose transport system permease protein
MFVEKSLTKPVPLTGGGDQKAFPWLALFAAFRAWLFLAILLATFEIWARDAYGGTFLFNPLNVKSIALFTVTPLLLGLGQTFVIISGGIDLSVGFTNNRETQKERGRSDFHFSQSERHFSR